MGEDSCGFKLLFYGAFSRLDLPSSKLRAEGAKGPGALDQIPGQMGLLWEAPARG